MRMIIDFFAQVANRSETMTADIAKVVIGMAGGPKDIFGELKNRYGVNAGLIIVAAAAQGSGPGQHRMTSFYREDLTELPELKKVAENYRDRGLEVIGPLMGATPSPVSDARNSGCAREIPARSAAPPGTTF